MPIRPRPAPFPKGREDRGAAREPQGRPISSAILDAAFRKAHGASPHGAAGLDRSRRRALLKIVRSTAVVRRQLRLKTKPFTKDSMTEFERLLADKAFGTGQLARALRRLQVADKRIGDLSQESQRDLNRVPDSDAIATLVRRVYGRLASHVREVEPDLQLLEKVRLHLKDRPHLDPAVPTVVIAGFPNVGKSSLVGKLSTAQPKVAAYPFTTLAIQVGHADLGFDRLQVLDTPGVLGRASHRNPAEAEAEMAVANAANVVLFVLDPTESCGYSMAEQESLLLRWKKEFPKAEILEVETKGDLAKGPTTRRRVSSTTGDGLKELRADIDAALARNPLPALPPPEEEIFRVEEYAPAAAAQDGSELPSPRRGRKRGK